MAVPILAILLSLCTSAVAHNGAVAIAAPVEGIAVDGDLSDWPEQARWYPVALVADGVQPVDGADLTARFKIGYSPGEKALYLGIEVHDSSVRIAAPGEPWYLQDGCELYLDLPHLTSGAYLRYAVLGDERLVYPRQGGILTMEDHRDVSVAIQRDTHGHRYEWRLEVGEMAPDFHLESNQVLGLDVAVFDSDAEGSSSWVSWGGGTEAYRLGDLVLGESLMETGQLGGSLRWSDTKTGVAHGQVEIRSDTEPGLHVRVATDHEGQYGLELPPGEYRVAPGIRGDVKERAVMVQVGDNTDFDLVAEPAGGQTVQAGNGKVALLSPAAHRGVWQTFTESNGLASPNIRDMVQDASGHMWFATGGGGISRFDGERFTTFTTEDGLASDWINQIVLDNQGRLWAASRGGVSRYDGLRFTTFTIRDGLADDDVTAVLEDRVGHLWFGTQGGGVSRFDGERFATFTAADGLASNRIAAMVEDDHGDLWFATTGGVTRYDGEIFTTFTAAAGLGDDRVTSAGLDSEGNVWFGTEWGGVSRFDGEVFSTFGKPDGLTDDWVFAIETDHEGNLWLGTKQGGVCRFDGRRFDCLTVEDGLADNWVHAITADREGSLWFGTKQGGAVRYGGLQFTTYTQSDGLVDNWVLSVAEDQQGFLWFGTEEGVSRFDGTRFESFSIEHGLGIGAGGRRVLDILTDRQGHVWFGTEGGLSRYDGSGFHTFTTKDGLAHNEVYALAEDSRGHLWVGTDGGGVSRYDGREFVNYTTDDGLADNYVLSMAIDGQDNLWFGSKISGATLYDGERFTTFTTADGLRNHDIGAIMAQRNGDVWFSCRGQGALRYDGDAFTNFTTADGLGGNWVWRFWEGPVGDLWFGSQGGGVTRYDGNVWQHLLASDGLAHDTATDFLQDRHGDTWITTLGGVTRYRPSRSPPPVTITDVVAGHRYGPVERLRLSASQDYLAVEFSGLSFKTRPGALVYQYRLAGYEEDWKSTTQPRVEYNDLPVGDYVFELQAVDRDMGYSEVPAVLRLTVQPAYARLGVIAALIGAAALILWQTYRIDQRGRRLRVSHGQLSEANQVIQQSDRAKSAFLTNMAHELRTPMDSILGFTQLLQHNHERNLTERQVHNLDTIRRNADSLLSLINQLLDLSRIEAGRMEIKIERFSVRELVRECLVTFEPLLQDKQVELRAEYGNAETLVCSDRPKVKQIIVNLLGNAVKFTDSGSVRVRTEHDGAQLRITVQDTGAGIEAGSLQSIFDEFDRADSAREGTGLGLTITRKWCRLLGGDITVESQLGKGSVFTVHLPMELVDG